MKWWKRLSAWLDRLAHWPNPPAPARPAPEIRPAAAPFVKIGVDRAAGDDRTVAAVLETIPLDSSRETMLRLASLEPRLVRRTRYRGVAEQIRRMEEDLLRARIETRPLDREEMYQEIRRAVSLPRDDAVDALRYMLHTPNLRTETTPSPKKTEEPKEFVPQPLPHRRIKIRKPPEKE